MRMCLLEFAPWSDGVPTGPVCLTMGVFDGAHAGHRELLHVARTYKTTREVQAVALTFDPHPDEVLFKQAVPLIVSVEQRIAHLKEQGIDRVLGLSFTTGTAEMGERDFIDALCAVLDVRMIVVGEDFRYGHRGEGDVESLRARGRVRGFVVRAVAKHHLFGAPVSSTRIRKAIAAGEMDAAAALLGRPYTVTLEVNDSPCTVWDACFMFPERHVRPAFGDYLGRIEFPDEHVPIVTHIEPDGYGGLLQLSLRGGAAHPMPRDGRVTMEFLSALWDRSDVRKMAASSMGAGL